MRTALEHSKEKLEECNKVLQSNQNVITFLNNQLNQSGIRSSLGDSPYSDNNSPIENISKSYNHDIHPIHDKGRLFQSQKDTNLFSSPLSANLTSSPLSDISNFYKNVSLTQRSPITTE